MPAFAATRRVAALLGAWRPPLSINISCLYGAQQQTCCSGVRRVTDGMDGETDSFIDLALQTVDMMTITMDHFVTKL